jgi:hypothetical protein
MKIFKDYLLGCMELKESAKVVGISDDEVKALERFPYILDHLSAISKETYDALKDKLSYADFERFKGKIGGATEIRPGEENRIPKEIRSVFQINPFGFSRNFLNKWPVPSTGKTFEGPGDFEL